MASDYAFTFCMLSLLIIVGNLKVRAFGCLKSQKIHTKYLQNWLISSTFIGHTPKQGDLISLQGENSALAQKQTCIILITLILAVDSLAFFFSCRCRRGLGRPFSQTSQ